MRHRGNRSPAAVLLLPPVILAVILAGCGGENPAPPPVQSAAPAAATSPSATSPSATTPPADPRKAADAALAAKVRAAIAAEPGLGVHELEIVASGGRITLFGTARSETTRAETARAAAAVPGVTAVDNRLAIVSGS